MERVRDDVLLVGRGHARIVYESEITRRDDLVTGADPMTGAPVYLLDSVPVEPDFDPKTNAPFVEQKIDERVLVRHIFWSDFRMQPQRCWDAVDGVAFRHVMSRRQLVAEFGEPGQYVSLTVPSHEGAGASQIDLPRSRRQIRRAGPAGARLEPGIRSTASGFGSQPAIRRSCALDPDPLGLRDFFPCPCPIYSSFVTTNTMVPLPELNLYVDQADELDEIQARVRHLEKVLRAVVLVDGSFEEITRIADAEDGRFIMVTRPGEAMGDLASGVWWWPVDRIVQVIEQLSRRAAELQNQIWQITGLHDVQRGAGKERESAAAQKLKTSFGTVRNTPRSLPMARFARDILRLTAEVMAELFDPATLSRIGGAEVTPEMLELLRSEKLRNTQISVATDATVRPDQQVEKEEATEFMAASTQFLQQVGAVGQAMPALVPLMLETFRQTAKTFKWAATVEPMIDQTVAMITQQVQQQLAMQQQQMAMQAEQQAAEQVMQAEQLRTQQMQAAAQMQATQMQAAAAMNGSAQ